MGMFAARVAAVGVAAMWFAAPATAGASEYRTSVLADGPTLYWHFDEATGPVVDNLASGDGSGDGTVLGSSVLGGPGAFTSSPHAATLDGTATITTPAAAPGRALAVEAWIKPNAVSSGTFLRYADAFELGYNAKRRLTVSIAGAAAKDTRVGLPPDRWTQVTVSFNTGTGADAQIFTSGGGWRVKTIRNAGVVPVLPTGVVTLGGAIGGVDELATFPDALTQTQARSHFLTAELPVATTRPVISGQPQSGRTLTASQATWPNATSTGVQWLRCDTADTTTGACDEIPGADGAAYVAGPADVGSHLALTEWAANTSGTGAVDALPVGPVVAPPPVAPGVPVTEGPVPGTGSIPGVPIPAAGAPATGGPGAVTAPAPGGAASPAAAAPACRKRLRTVAARRLTVKRLGRLTATVAAAASGKVTIAVKAAPATRRRVARIVFKLDRRTLKGRSRLRRTVALAKLAPGRHALAITVVPRAGKRRTLDVPLRVTPC